MASSSVETNELSSVGKNNDVNKASTGNVMMPQQQMQMQSPSSVVDSTATAEVDKTSEQGTFSPDSPLYDPFGPNKDKIIQESVQSPPQLSSLSEHEIISPPGLLAASSSSSNNNTMLGGTESPPEDQVMERTTPNSKYRIPSHVFSRSKSNTPVEWSVASNDSLFSIQMGNMSFTKDPFLWRLDDLAGTPTAAAIDESTPSQSGSHQMFNYSGSFPPPTSSNKAAFDGNSKELVIIGEEVPHGPSETQGDQIQLVNSDDQDRVSSHCSPAAAAEKNDSTPVVDVDTMKKDLSLRENQYQIPEKPTTANPHLARLSGESNNSTKSFAFPM